jgi:hypothetical protein
MNANEINAIVAQAVAAALAASGNTPKEAITTDEELAKRTVKHNAIMRQDIDHRKGKLCIGFDYGVTSEQLFTGPEDRRHECFADVMAQACWGICNGSVSQYMWHRMLSDQAYLKLSNLQEENGHGIREESGETETGMEMNRDYMATERNYAYHITTAYAYEVNMHAAFELWSEIQQDKADEFYERNQGNPDALYTNRSRAPSNDIGDVAYAAYLGKRADKKNEADIKNGQHAMMAARLLRLTRLADEPTEEHVHD